MIELTAAVRRGAPLAMIWADMPFGSYQRSTAQGVRNICRMLQLSGADAVKIESAVTQIPLVSRLADAGVAVVAHLGLRPQFIGRLGEYKTQGRSASDAMKVVELSRRFADAGAAAILLEAVPPEVSAAVVAAVSVPVIGCGAGPACHGHVFVTHDALRLTTRKPRFVPELGDLASPMKSAFERYVGLITDRAYPSAEHLYAMPADERSAFVSPTRPAGGV
jgi:3-methyl-2-oxobutanoate hydroxymethyltransferase